MAMKVRLQRIVRVSAHQLRDRWSRSVAWARSTNGMSVIAGLAVLSFVLLQFPATSFAATGDEVFKTAATDIACKVMPKKFGAMLAGFAGLFALISAVTGSYKGAWALLFVSIGAFIFPEVIGILFKGTVSC